MKKLFSYIVDHDYGYAPNPYNGFCTLVHCKFKSISNKRRNIVELANVGDWILGSGGKNSASAGNNKIIYLMRVDEKLDFDSYLKDSRFHDREDCIDNGDGNQFALISEHYFYFGKNAIDKNKLPLSIPLDKLFKTNQGFRSDFPIAKIDILIKWFECNYKIGMHGNPCGVVDTTIKTKKFLANSCKNISISSPKKAKRIC